MEFTGENSDKNKIDFMEKKKTKTTKKAIDNIQVKGLKRGRLN